MTTNDVISTIENATASLFQVLREQEANNSRLQSTIDRLEARVTWLESQLKSAREWGESVTVERDAAHLDLHNAKVELDRMKDAHASDLDRLTNIIRSIGAAIDPVVNPPYVPKPGEQPRDLETGRFRPWSEANPEGYTSADLEPKPSMVEPFPVASNTDSKGADDKVRENEATNPSTDSRSHDNSPVAPQVEPNYPRAVNEDWRF